MNEIKLFIKGEYIFLIVIFGFIIDPWFKGLYLAYIIPVFLLFELKLAKRNLDTKFIFLFLFCIFYVLFYLMNPKNGPGRIGTYLSFSFTYIIGKILSNKYKSAEVYYFLFIFLMISNMFIPTISIVYHIVNEGFHGSRNLSTIWDLSKETVATGMAASFNLSISSFSLLFVPYATKFQNNLKRIILVAFIISIICILRLASKTQISVLAITFFVTFFYLFPRQSIIRSFVALIIMLFVFFAGYYLHIKNAPILNTFNERIENEDLETTLSGTGRTVIWSNSINNIITHPTGWNPREYGNFRYSHNLWIDVASVGGIIPFIFMVIFTIGCISMVYKAIGSNNTFFNINVLCSFLGLMAFFFVEPVIEGMPEIFLSFCLLMGFLSGFTEVRTKKF